MPGSSAPAGQERTDPSEAIIDVVAVPICVIDRVGRIVRWNQAAIALTGLSGARVRGRDFQETLLFPGDVEKWKLELARISTGSSARHFEIRWRIHDDSALTLICSCPVIRDPAGNIEYIVCAVIERASAIGGEAARASLSSEFMTDRIAELRDISRVLHDTISQDLVALSFNVGNLESMAIGPERQIEAAAALELIDRCCRDIRVIGYMLAPPSLSETTLEASIERFAGYVRKETGLAIGVDLDPLPGTVSPEAQLLLFAAVQGWTVRGIRSGPKTELSVRLRNRGEWTVLELEMTRVSPIVPATVLPPDAGWTIVRERARALGGEFDIAIGANLVSARMSLPGSGER